MVNQETGEDWNDTKVVLSTASPSYCGNVPELETQNVRIRFREEYLFKINVLKSIKLYLFFKKDKKKDLRVDDQQN